MIIPRIDRINPVRKILNSGKIAELRPTEVPVGRILMTSGNPEEVLLELSQSGDPEGLPKEVASFGRGK